MPKFSVKDLLIATALIAFGFGALWTVFNPPESWRRMKEGMFLAVLIWMSAGALIGAAIGRLVKCTWRGIAVGFGLSLVIGMTFLFLFVGPE